jgi:Flp pilus assembly protein CpaB
LTTVKLDGLRLTSKTVLQRVKVVAVTGAVDGVSFSRPADGKKKKLSDRSRRSVVTLLLTPQQAEDMAVAVRAGKIDLVLRGASDDVVVDTSGANTNRLFGREVESPDGEEGSVEPSETERVVRPRRKTARRPRRGPVRRRPTRRAPRRAAPAPRAKSGSAIIVGGDQ